MVLSVANKNTKMNMYLLNTIYLCNSFTREKHQGEKKHKRHIFLICCQACYLFACIILYFRRESIQKIKFMKYFAFLWKIMMSGGSCKKFGNGVSEIEKFGENFHQASLHYKKNW